MYTEEIRVCTIVHWGNQSVYCFTENKSEYVPLYREKVRFCTIVHRENQILYHFIRQKSEFVPFYNVMKE